MASMAAAIAASRSVVMSGNRALDERERKRFSYFASLSPMARRILQDQERVRERPGPGGARPPPPAPQDAPPGRCLAGPEPPPPPPGRKLVRFGDEDITWQDEHSAPFSWETRSQMEFSISSLSIQDPPATAAEPRPQAGRPAPGAKSSGPDAPGPARRDEEAAFWKINAERARGEGPEAAFPSLTPSQIKSMEKGEKVLPRDREAPASTERPGPLPPGPPPVQARCPGPSGEGAPSEPAGKALAPGAGPTDGETVVDELFPEPSAAQVSTSSVILKTGFDFLDNW